MNNGHHSNGNYRQNLPQHQTIWHQNSQAQQGWGEHQQQSQQNLQHGNQHSLPLGWVEATDPSSGKVYYCNPQTRETKWERPMMPMTNSNKLAPQQSGNNLAVSRDRTPLQGQTHNTWQGQQQQLVQPPLPQGWVEATDPNSGKIYYCNPHTRETKWERPISTTPASSSTRLENGGGSNGYGSISASKIKSAADFSGTGPESNVTHIESKQSISSPVIATSAGANIIGHNHHKADNNDFDELRFLTTGQIAHLIRLQQHQESAQKLAQSEEERQVQISTIVSNRSSKDYDEQNDGSSHDPPKYAPIHISLMSALPSMEPTEPGRLDVRMFALREELKKFGYNQ